MTQPLYYPMLCPRLAGSPPAPKAFVDDLKKCRNRADVEAVCRQHGRAYCPRDDFTPDRCPGCGRSPNLLDAHPCRIPIVKPPDHD